MDDIGWGGLGWPDGGWNHPSLEEVIAPPCTATPDCQGRMEPVDEATLRCTDCGKEIPIGADEKKGEAKDADEEQR